MLALLLQLRDDSATPEERGGWRKHDVISARLWEDRRFFAGRLSSKDFVVVEHQDAVLENRLRTSLIVPISNFIPYPYRDAIVPDGDDVQWRRSRIRINFDNVTVERKAQIEGRNRVSPELRRTDVVVEQKPTLTRLRVERR